jgi:hypothetical protein
VKIEGASPLPNLDMSAIRVSTGPGYLGLMGTPLVAGRDIALTDRAGTLPVVVVNETFARRFFPNQSAIGRRTDAGRGWATIVGVAADGKYGSLTERPQAVAYVPILQWYQTGITVFARTPGNPLTLAEPVRRVLQAVEVDLPALQPRTLAEHIAGATFVQRTGAAVLSGFGAAALALSLVGLYGALAVTVALRRRELGIRMTLGAPARSIAWLVLRHGYSIALSGLAVGVPLAFIVSRALRGHFDTLGDVHASSVALAILLIAVCATTATLWPARRAAMVDPNDSLRNG